MLRECGGAGGGVTCHGAFGGLGLPSNQSDQRTLPAAIPPNYCNSAVRLDAECHILYDLVGRDSAGAGGGGIAEAGALQLYQRAHVAQWFRIGQIQPHPPLALVDLHGICSGEVIADHILLKPEAVSRSIGLSPQSIQLFLTASNHAQLLVIAGLLGLANSRFYALLNVCPLALNTFFQLQCVLVLVRHCLHVLVVIARVIRQPAAPQHDHLVAHRVQEGPVVGNRHKGGAGQATQVPLQPQDGWQVQVVGGLIQQQQVRLEEQRLRQRNPDSPPT
mmetsp:Transcript_12888/g.38928  ORF Transcript_12888/g.38928 Transcript_12888/m.38928 type:complete len:276 (+) Transcript_12888:1319-2146(+)